MRIDQQPYIQGYLAVQQLTWIVRYDFLGIPGDIISTAQVLSIAAM
ncbi:MAG: hypothetical protein R2880_09760 [Deinococcales bacterium]